MQKECVLLISILVFGLFCSGIVLAEENDSVLESATGTSTVDENENTVSEQAEGDTWMNYRKNIRMKNLPALV